MLDGKQQNEMKISVQIIHEIMLLFHHRISDI